MDRFAEVKDPIQKQLRLDKKMWNKQFGEFVSDLANFKRLMVGTPSKFFAQKGKITEPIPSDPAKILSVLTGRFQQLANESLELSNRQVEYSRQFKQIKQDKINKKGELNFDDEFLSIEASNRLTRFWSALKGPYFGEAGRKRSHRRSLLSALVKIEKNLKDLESQILESSGHEDETKSGIFKAHALLNSAITSFRSLKELYANYDMFFGDKPELTQGDKPPVAAAPTTITEDKDETVSQPNQSAPVVPEAQTSVRIPPVNNSDKNKITPNTLSDHMAMATAIIQLMGSQHPKLFDSLNKLKNVRAKQRKNEASISDIQREYNNFVQAVQLAGRFPEDNLEDIIKAISKTKQGFKNADELQKFAANSIKKWLLKKKLQILGGDQTVASRIDIYDASVACRKEVDELMDKLESDINKPEVAAGIALIENKLFEIKKLMQPLVLLMRGMEDPNDVIALLENGRFLGHKVNVDENDKKLITSYMRRKKVSDLLQLFKSLQ